uniref:Uncharacterized protein n=1 Tax=Meloidogyne enterolobii TaxID=390850 RepID=A0A6V7X277_MELEN|nr:unnamed protein product [Meloidogyne enterolobii]CAD2208109.1 unnamed protein product [Meloidogyne enterolobii]
MDEFDEFSLITKLDQQKLTHLLVSIPGTKELFVESNLLRPLDKICSMKILRSLNCQRVQQLYLDKTNIWDEQIEQRIFFIRPSIAISRKICELIRSEPEKPYSIIHVGSLKNFFLKELEKNGLGNVVNFYEFNLTLINLESDLFSLELPQYPPEMFNRYFEELIKTFWQLQTLYGQIQTIFGFGDFFPIFDKLFKRICNELGEPTFSSSQFISHLFIFDRRLDLFSTLLTGLTYESILNDMFNYNCGKISFGEPVNSKLFSSQNSSKEEFPQKSFFPLNNSDLIFSSIRNSHMTKVFPFLREKYKSLQSGFAKVSTIQKVDEMKIFVSNEFDSLRDQQKQFEIHICACEYIIEKTQGLNEQLSIENTILRGEFKHLNVFNFLLKMITLKYNQWSILQLASIWCLRANGIPEKYFYQFQEVFLHRYGFDQLLILYQLSINGLLYKNNTSFSPLFKARNPFSKRLTNKSDKQLAPINLPTKNEMRGQLSESLNSIINGLQLIPQNDEEQQKRRINKLKENNLEDFSDNKNTTNNLGLGYVFSNTYIPLISSIIDRIVTMGWDENYLKKVIGEDLVFCTNPNAKAPDNRIRRALLVCFVGGVTFAEIASLRCFAQNCDFRLIILTTHIINRERSFKSYAGFSD